MTPPRPTWLLPLALVACGNAELDALETEQAELRQRVDELKTNVGVLRGEMVEAGLISAKQAQLRSTPEDEGKAGKTRRRDAVAEGGKGFGHPLPGTDLGGDLTVTAQRTGTPPELPELVDMERTDTPCGHKFVIRDLQPLSDYPLNSAGFGKAGPIVMLEDGKPMASHALPADFDERCAGAFRHAGYALFFSPSGDASAAASHTYELAHSDEVPMPRGDDGRPMYWIYPGTTLELSVSDGWDPSWGEMVVSIGGRVATASTVSPTVKVAGEQLLVPANGRPQQFGLQETIERPPEGRWKIEIESPKDGPYVLLGTLTVGNDQNALVITAEEAFAHGGE